jgi:hypothetical protein
MSETTIVPNREFGNEDGWYQVGPLFGGETLTLGAIKMALAEAQALGAKEDDLFYTATDKESDYGPPWPTTVIIKEAQHG